MKVVGHDGDEATSLKWGSELARVVVCPVVRGTNHHDYVVQAIRKVIRDRNSYVGCYSRTRVTLV
jgi:hypothetical protein